MGDFQTHNEFGHSDWDFSFDVAGLLLTFRSSHTTVERSEQQNKVVLKARHYLLFKQLPPAPPTPLSLTGEPRVSPSHMRYMAGRKERFVCYIHEASLRYFEDGSVENSHSSFNSRS